MRKDEREMRRRRRQSLPDIMNVIYTMTMLANEFGLDARVAIDRLHVLVSKKLGQLQAENFYADILAETEAGYAIPDFWRVVISLWLMDRVGRDLYNEARILEGKYTEAKRCANVDFAFDAMLKKCGPLVLVERDNGRGYEFTSWVASSTYEVN